MVVDVIDTVFGSGGTTVGLDRPPHDGSTYDERLSACLAQRVTVDRIVATVLSILAEGE